MEIRVDLLEAPEKRELYFFPFWTLELGGVFKKLLAIQQKTQLNGLMTTQKIHCISPFQLQKGQIHFKIRIKL